MQIKEVQLYIVVLELEVFETTVPGATTAQVVMTSMTCGSLENPGSGRAGSVLSRVRIVKTHLTF